MANSAAMKHNFSPVKYGINNKEEEFSLKEEAESSSATSYDIDGNPKVKDL